MKIFELEQIIKNGGATLEKSGACVDFLRGYQVSKRDVYTLNAENVNDILRAVNKLLCTIKAGEFVGLSISFYVENFLRVSFARSKAYFRNDSHLRAKIRP